MSEITVNIPIHRYEELLQIEKEFNSKNFFITVHFMLGRDYHPYCGERLYYETDENVPQRIKEYSQLFQECFEGVKALDTPKELETFKVQSKIAEILDKFKWKRS